MNKNPNAIIRAPSSAEMQQVRALWRANSRTLGFLPDGAFDDAYRTGRILVACANGPVLGYLLYRISRGRGTIVHLCTAPDGRRQGAAKIMIDHLRMVTKSRGLLGIGLYCRRDYDLAGFWSRLGFVPIHEKDGKSVNGSVLTYWWIDHQQPDLFSLATADDQMAEKTPVAIDANILIRMHQEDEHDENLSAKALAADWIQDQIELCVTDEVLIEIDRSNSKERRGQSRSWAKQHRRLAPSPDEIEEAQKTLRQYFNPDGMVLEQDISDYKHLVNALAAGVPYLVTMDGALLKRAAQLPGDIGIEVLDPATFVLRLDELRRQIEYAPSRLSGSQVRTRLVRDQDRDALVSTFQAVASSESRSQMAAKLRTFLSAAGQCDTHCVVCPQRGFIGLYAVRSVEAGRREIPMFRFVKSAIGATVARRILSDMICDDAAATEIRVTDPLIERQAGAALAESGFTLDGGGTWRRVRLSGFHSVEASLRSIRGDVMIPPARSAHADMEQSAEIAYAAELAIWPGKIEKSPLPTFGIPIRPAYAMQLFDEGLAGADLIGAKAELAMACEQIYYRANQKCGLTAPARIVWYVSKGKNVPGTMTVRASSLLDEVLVDTPKNLYRKFKRLGVYEWRDLARMVKDPAKDLVMALRFSHTETFAHPVPVNILRQFGVRSNFQSPVRLPVGTFEAVYNMGQKNAKHGDDAVGPSSAR